MFLTISQAKITFTQKKSILDGGNQNVKKNHM
jgi:hypothetical protein